MFERLGLLAILFASLTISAQEKLHLKGKISGISDEAQLTLIAGDQEENFQAKEGVFEVELQVKDAPQVVYLYVDEAEDSKYTSFYLGNESVSIEGSIEQFPHNIQALDSKYDGLRYEHHLINKDLNDLMDTYQIDLMQLAETVVNRDSLFDVFYSEVEPLGKMKKIVDELAERDFIFMKKHINTEYGRSMLQYTSSRLTIKQINELWQLIDPQFENTTEVQFLKTLADYSELKIGDGYYNFTALDKQGQSVQFSDFFKGKYVLLDFSTMHCGYCQMAAPKTAKLAEELKDKVTYVTYYVDSRLDTMEMYYELKGNQGILLWNEKGRLDTALAKYRNTGTPNYVLFDSQGKVKNILDGYSEDLVEHLKALID